MNKIKFLGTAGARFVVIKQLRSSGGIWFSLDETNILLDPGPGSLVKCWSSRPKLDPLTLNAIILSHRHLDHSSDLNIMVEAMTDGGFKKKGAVYLPRDAFKNEAVIFKYLHKALASINILKEKSKYKILNIEILTTGKLVHPVETYGLKFRFSKGIVGYVSDTRFFPELVNYFKKSDVLIINTVLFAPLNKASDIKKAIDHLTLSDAINLIKSIKPKITILTHFGMSMIKNKPWKIAEKISSEINLEVIAASDGMELDLDKLI